MLKNIIALIRIKQWVKNLFVFLPIFFAGKLLSFTDVIQSLTAFFSFCFIASIIYTINDYSDIESDKYHPKKKHRPLASGVISKSQAKFIMVGFIFLVSLLLIVSSSIDLAIVIGVYFILNLLYTFKLKHIPLIDITIIALGFVLRLAAGGASSDTKISQWAIILTFSLALILALAKRRGELISSSSVSRPALKGYSQYFIDISMTMVSSITIVAYIMYTLSAEVQLRIGQHCYITGIFVILGILRYLQQSFIFNRTESPTKMLYSDNFLQIMIGLWVLSFMIFIYL